MSPYLPNDLIRQTATRPGASELSGSQQEQLKLWDQDPQVTPAHGSPEIFTPGTVLAEGLGLKTYSRHAAAEQELTGPSTSLPRIPGKAF